MEEVESSSLSSSTLRGLSETLCSAGYLLGGLVAGEGCFSVTRRLPAYADGSTRHRFVFCVTLATHDRPLLEALRAFLQVGSINDRAGAKRGHQPLSTFFVGSHRAHHAAVIPFAERFLLLSAKRRQFEEWRDALLCHEAAHPSHWRRGRSTCSHPGCDRPVRGQGLCRRHYYRATGY